MTYEKRELPRKTIIIIFIICIVALCGFLFLQFLKEQKIVEILSTLGYKNVSKVKVVNKLNVEDMQTKMKSSVFKVAFYDEDLKQTCMGFLHHERDNSYTKDLDCK
ncbi:hypothetical protein AFAEC_1990 [Aliarcobacter faecis]|uniref:hypothetical protein n=1 Tax=Aliarcobacter faecis TaxID=1564138 RepID=UPI00047D1BD6|nr:hypothetical protein [Aliarcobacter faecis]QKF74141.1 hypothetical protein AFAEC_1990 [Aliarcobacter faecis]